MEKHLVCFSTSKEARVAGAKCARAKAVREGNLEAVGGLSFFLEK